MGNRKTTEKINKGKLALLRRSAKWIEKKEGALMISIRKEGMVVPS